MIRFLEIYLVFLSAATAFGQTTGCRESFLCTTGFCNSTCAPQDCYVPTEGECNGVLLPLYENEYDVCSCCPYRCLEYKKLGDFCESKTNDMPKEMCGPGLTCRKLYPSDKQKQCCHMDTKCVTEKLQMENDQGMNQRAPDCDEEGFYLPTQCYPGGLCRCVDRYSGDPVALGFGLSAGVVDSIENEMDCRCAQSYHESLSQGCRMSISSDHYATTEHYLLALDKCLEESSKKSAMLVNDDDDELYFSGGYSRCLPNGNFDPIQCMDRPGMDGLCVCVDRWIEGYLRPNGTSTFLSTITNLNCFDENLHNPNYYRECESKVLSLQQKDFDIYIVAEIPPICTPDGNYAKLQHNYDGENFTSFCSNRDGQVLETFANISQDSLPGKSMNCECATARHYLSSRPNCCANGNFEGKQCVAGFCFCVDQYGRQIGPEVDQIVAIDQLHCQDYCCDKEEPSYVDGDWCFKFLL